MALSTAEKVLRYTAACRAVVKGLPVQIIPVPDSDDIKTGVLSNVVDGIGYVEGAPNYTITEQIAIHEHGHLRDKNRKYERDIFWAWRFAGIPSAPSSWAEADRDAHPGPGVEVWHVLPVETIAEAFVTGVTNGKYRERTLNYGEDADPHDMRIFFGGGPLDIIVLPSPNFTVVPNRGIKYKVIHTTEGYDSRNILTDGNRPNRVSAHYLIRHEGIYQLVPERLAAWHAGKIVGTPTTPLYTPGINPNNESIGIEIEGFSANAIDTDLFAKLISLIRDIDTRYGVTPNIGHFELSPGDRSDPGRDNLLEINAAIAAEEDDMFTEEDRKMLKRIYDHEEAYEQMDWIGRLQDWLAKAIRSVFPHADLTGPDIKTNLPYKEKP